MSEVLDQTTQVFCQISENNICMINIKSSCHMTVHLVSQRELSTFGYVYLCVAWIFHHLL